MAGLDLITQADFSAGAFPGFEDIPPNGCEDIVDGFLRDDGAIERRGGTQYKSNANLGGVSDLVLAVNDLHFAVGARTVAVVGSGGAGTLHVLNPADGATPISLNTIFALDRPPRPAVIAGVIVWPTTVSGARHLLLAYGGDHRAGGTASEQYGTGQATVTRGSKTVTGSGTSWSANVRPGMLFKSSAAFGPLAVIASVESNTSLTLSEPWPYGSEGPSGYLAASTLVNTQAPVASATGEIPRVASVADRLVFAQGRRVRFSKFNVDSSNNALPSPFEFDPTDYHDLPEGVVVTGLEQQGDSLYVFTTAGVWVITDLAFDLTDDAGNPQQRIEQVGRDLVLWDDSGIATWQNAIVAPALDDIYLLRGADMRPIAGGGRKLYREYVDAGYAPGQAVVYRGHYFLPILNGMSPVDLLVWQLSALGDRGAPMMRWAGHAGQSMALTVRVGATPGRQPKLLAGAGRRVVDLTGAFSPTGAVKADATGTAHQLKVTTRGHAVSEAVSAMWERCRARFELDDAATDNPTVAGEYSSGRPGGVFSALTSLDAQQEGDVIYRFAIVKRAQQIRVRLTQSGAASRCILRAVDVFVRSPGRS